MTNSAIVHPLAKSTIVSPMIYQPSQAQQNTGNSHHHNYKAVETDSLERKIKDLMREAACLMEIVLNNKQKITLDEQQQEKVRLVEDK